MARVLIYEHAWEEIPKQDRPTCAVIVYKESVSIPRRLHPAQWIVACVDKYEAIWDVGLFWDKEAAVYFAEAYDAVYGWEAQR